MLRPAAPRLRACSTRPSRNAIPPSHPWVACRRISPVLGRSPRASFATVTSDAEHDIVRQVFDQPKANRWLNRLWRGDKETNAGLFKNRYLTKPEGFHVFAQRNVQKASGLVLKVMNASSLDEYRAVVKHLDRLSDLLCRVLDLCDFVRMTHPDPEFQNAASDAWAMVYQYMNQLNTTTGLNDQLRKAMENPDVTSTWTEEEMIVAKTLRIDFEKSAVHLPENVRDSFVTKSQQISETGARFVETMAPASPYFNVPLSELNNLPQRARQSVNAELARKTSGRITGLGTVPSVGSAAFAVQQKSEYESSRRAAYLASNTASPRTIQFLESMLRLRNEVAKLTGFESYGHQHLQDRMMAKSPAAVMQFLKALHKHNAPVVQQEVSDLLKAKKAFLGDYHTQLHAWDSEFCKSAVRLDMTDSALSEHAHVPLDKLANYFSVGTVMKGLSILFNRLYGIRLVPREPLPGEVWHPDVRRLDVVSEKGDLIAVLYCDLFFREEKSPNPAHYTVRCSRDIRDEEIAEAAEDMGLAGFESPEASANDGMETAREDGVLKQLPTVVLVCDFAPPAASQPSTLQWRNVETLFHEMGHAVHSILARTTFQNVAGTRCATDLAELPSTLMEHFAADATVLRLFARHWQTEEPLPYEALATRVRLAKRFEGLDTERQIILAIADQVYHSAAAGDPSFDSTKVWHEVQAEYAVGPRDDSSTSWQGFFGHLFGYGSTYYSYLFDRVLAERVWKVVFKAGEGDAAVSRENGEWLKENLLKWGGGRDPWRCMADTLKDERIAEGGEDAMEIVGSWGLKEVK
ncbi:hypothetical protein VUR80DRAFT_2649 [Thermomyces stellatus]